MLHDLSHSNSHILEFQTNPSSHLPLPINYLRSYLHLSLFQGCLLLETLASNLHLQVKVSWQDACLVSLILHITLNTLIFMSLATSVTHNLAYRSLILLQVSLHLFTRIL